jgi:hypothetical protein
MLKFKGTQGPWLMKSSSLGVHKYIDARIGGGLLQEVAVCGPTEQPEQSSANAALIAAAPDLLEALQGLMALLDPDIHGSRGSALENARAAIAKALGEEK